MNREVSTRVFWRFTIAALVATACVAASVKALRRSGPSSTAARAAPELPPARTADEALHALRGHLARTGLDVLVEDGRAAIAWNGFALARHSAADYLRAHTFTFLARRGARAAPDVYRGSARVTPAGVPIEVADVVNLTRTEHGEELALAVSGPFVAYANRIEGALNQVVLLDYRGEPPAEGATTFDRVMDAVANWQELKDRRGVGRRLFDLAPGQKTVALAFDDEQRLHVKTDRGVAELAADSGEILKNSRIAAKAPDSTKPAHPSTPAAGELAPSTLQPLIAPAPPAPRTKRMFIDWIANTLRRAIGEERFEWVKVYALGLKDKWQRLRTAVFGATAPAADEVETARVVTAHAPVRRMQIDFGQDPHWPPPPLQPILASPKLAGEGQWVDIYDFDLRNTDAPPPLLKTILRPDPKRPHAAVRLVLIDPRQVELNVVAGTRHPQSTTGFQGDGIIPRDKATLSRLLAAFNGGFKTMHGSYGMVIKGKAIVPTKNGAATVARMKDGRVAFGTWDLPDGTLLKGALAIRQNLPPLIEAGVINPTGQKKWGNVVMNLDSDGKHTYRSAFGVTRHGHLLYVWGDDLSHETLAQAMLRAGCDYAIHLDMNYGHSRLEFYRVYDEETIGRARPDRKLYTEGPLRYQAKKLSKAQISWLYPRYIKRDIRDFFYLTLRRVFPYSDESTATSPAWTTEGLPEELREWPPLIVRADAKVGLQAVKLFKLDAARLRLALRHASGRLPSRATEIDRADLQRLTTVIGLGAPAAAPRARGVDGRYAATSSARRDGGPVIPRGGIPRTSQAGNPRSLRALPGDARLIVDAKGRLSIAARGDTAADDAASATLAGTLLLDGGKVLEVAEHAGTGGAVGVDARGDLLLAYGAPIGRKALAEALLGAGAVRAIAQDHGGFLRVFTPGEREGELIATRLESGAKETLRALPLGYDQPFLYGLAVSPPRRVVALDALADVKAHKGGATTPPADSERKARLPAAPRRRPHASKPALPAAPRPAPAPSR